MDFDTRFEAILHEVGNTRWDVFLFTETWRESKDEVFTTAGGHTWFGSGGTKGSNGVGFLLHRRWGYTSFKAVSERVAMLTLAGDASKLNLVSVYMPHSKYSDIDVEAACESLDSLLLFPGHFIVAGDMNAEVGPRSLIDDDEANILGPNPINARNQRGERLLHWCSLHDFFLANTFDSAHPEQLW
eukprot:4101563-Pyramimonas_sp.AAC.1